MKHGIVLVLMSLAVPVFAQDPAQLPAAPPPPESLDDGRQLSPPEDAGPRPGFGLDFWLDRVKEQNPQEFERLKKLRGDDPEAFHAEARKMIRREIGERLKRERPAVFAALEKLSPEDREWVFSRMQPRGGMWQGQGGELNRRGDGARGQGPGPGPENGEEAIRSLAKSYREADEPNKAEIREKIRKTLTESFERRSERRRNELAQFEKRIGEMRKVVEERQANRDAIIDKRLKEITEDENLAW